MPHRAKVFANLGCYSCAVLTRIECNSCAVAIFKVTDSESHVTFPCRLTIGELKVCTTSDNAKILVVAIATDFYYVSHDINEHFQPK